MKDDYRLCTKDGEPVFLLDGKYVKCGIIDFADKVKLSESKQICEKHGLKVFNLAVENKKWEDDF